MSLYRAQCKLDKTTDAKLKRVTGQASYDPDQVWFKAAVSATMVDLFKKTRHWLRLVLATVPNR